MGDSLGVEGSEGGEMNWGGGVVVEWEVAGVYQRSLCAQRRACSDQRLRALAASPPLLVSPLKGGRDELGREVWLWGGRLRASSGVRGVRSGGPVRTSVCARSQRRPPS